MVRYRCFVLLLFMITLCVSVKVYAYFDFGLPLFQKVIYIDPGHGGIDPGAVYKDVRESDINLTFSLAIGQKLESLGATVFYTRKGDYDLAITHTRRKRSDLSLTDGEIYVILN